MDTIKPLGQRVVVKQDEKTTQTETGIFITGNLEGSIRRGEVIAVGPQVYDIKAGDRVIYESFTGNPITFRDEDYLTMFQAEILGIEEDV